MFVDGCEESVRFNLTDCAISVSSSPQFPQPLVVVYTKPTMSKRVLLMVLGILVFVTPFMGLPSSYQTPLFVFWGISIFLTAYAGRRKNTGEEDATISTEKISDQIISPSADDTTLVH